MPKVTEEELARIEVFQGISRKSMEQLISCGRSECYKAGAYLFGDKEKVNNFYAVIDGSVSLFKINTGGQKRGFFILGKGKCVNEAGMMDYSSAVWAQVFENAVIFCCSKQDLYRIMQEDFVLVKNMMDEMSMKIRRLYRQLNNSVPGIKIEKKLAAKIWKLCKDHGTVCPEGTVITVPISITYLADLLGSSRETVSRAMKILVQNGYLTCNDKKIIVKNPEELARFFKAL